jgi:hypothetical protein
MLIVCGLEVWAVRRIIVGRWSASPAMTRFEFESYAGTVSSTAAVGLQVSIKLRR